MEWTKFTIYDSKIKSSLTPFYAQTVPAGLRQWHYNCNRPDSDYNRYPGDYTLFELGTYEGDTMVTKDHKTPINHGLAQIQIEEIT